MCVSAIIAYLVDYLQDDTRKAALLRALKLIVTVIKTPDILQACDSRDLKVVLAQRLIEFLTHLLRGEYHASSG